MTTIPAPTHTAARRPPRRVAAFLAALLALLFVAGCSWTENDTKVATYGLPDLRQSLMAEEWVLDAAASSVDGAGDAEVTLSFAEDTLGGAGPCNSYFGDWSPDDGSIEVGPLGSTLRACEDQGRMDAETAYLAALEGTLDVDDTDRDRLVLTRDGVHLEYRAAD
jgi:heat shock protein HslJ